MATITQAAIDDFDNNGVVLGVNFVAATDGQTINAGDTITGEAKAGFEINSITQSAGYNPVTGMTDVYEFTISTDKTQGTWDYVDGVNLEYFTINTSTVQIQGLEVTQTIIDEHTNKNVVLGVDSVAVEVGQIIQSGQTVTIEPLSGYIIFPQEVTGSYDPISGVTTTFEYSVNEAGTLGSVVYDESDLQDTCISGALGFGVEQTSNIVQGTNNVYLVTLDDLKTINESRFVLAFEGTSDTTTIDYGKYILSLISLPTEIDPELIGNNKQVSLGEINVNPSVPTILTDQISVDMGVITTPEPNGDLRDFSNTECVLHLPYSQPISIEPDYVIGQTISIEYIIDAYSGEATINIFSTKVGEVFITQKSTLGINIPYSLTFNNVASAENSNIVVGGDNQITNPYLEVIRNEAMLVDGVFNIPIIDEDLIINHTGFIKVEEIELEIDATYSEKESVVNALQNGVIIK